MYFYVTVLPRNNLTLRLPASCVHGARVLRPQRPRLASTAPASCVHSARVLRPQRPRLASELPASCVQLKIASDGRSVRNSVRKSMLGVTEMYVWY